MSTFDKKAERKKRKTAEKMDRKKYGRGKSGKAAKAADVAKQAALAKLKRIGDQGKNTDNTKVKDADTMDMPIADRERSTVYQDKETMGMSMYGKKHGSSMSGEKYDAKQAYNKSLSPKARLHYLENERHDKTNGHAIHKHMKKF